MSFTLKTAPAVEPLTKAEVKLHTRIEADETAEDNQLDILIKAAREHVESVTRRPLITQVWTYKAPCFADLIELKANLASVDEIRYIDTDGVQQTLASSVYSEDVSAVVGRVYPAYGQSWPSVRNQINAVEIDFTVGYGDAGSDVPESIRAAMLLLIAHWYENRTAVMVGVNATKTPIGFDMLIAPYKVWTL